MDDVNTINNNSNEENDEENISMTLGPFQMSHTVLGKGTFGTVYLGTHNKTKEKVAIKEIRKIKFEKDEKNKEVIKEKESMYSDLLKQELEITEKLHHPYICRMLYKVQYNEDWYIVFEYLSGKQFFDNEEIDFTEAKNKKFFCQILSAIEYLHKNKIVHRDIKLENILFDDNEDAKLIDFGLSKYIKNNELLSDKPGSEIYTAPEILLTDDKYDGFLADIWSLGICFYAMKFFNFPFLNENYNSYSECLKNEKLTFPEDRKASPQFKDLIKRILEKDPKKRITLEQIKQHPWVHSLDFNFLKSPGINLTQDVIPIDLEIVREMGLNDEQKIKKIIKDILANFHNKYTSNYYLRIEQKKKKKIKSIADLRPTSELFINYINSEKSKLKYYNNDINKICEEYTKKIMKQIQEEAIAFGKIKNSIVEDANKINNDNNKNNLDKVKNSNKKNKKMKARSRSFGKLSLLKKYLKEENNANNNKLSGQIIKVNKIKLMDKYISPVIFIHGIIDDIIYKVLQSIEDDKKNVNDNLKIEVQHPNNIEINQEPEKQIIKNNNFTINLIEEFVYIPAIKNADKTVSYGFYKPKNKNKFQTIKTEETSNEKNKNQSKLYDKNKNKDKNNIQKNLNSSKYVNHSSLNINSRAPKKIKNLKTESNKNNQKIKNGGIIYNIKKTFANAVTTITNKFHKSNKFTNINPKKINIPKPKKRRYSIKINSRLNLNDEEINKLLSRKRSNSLKKNNKIKKKEKNFEKKAEKFINKLKFRNSEKINEKNLEKNLNINEVISQRNSGEQKIFKKNLKTSKSIILPRSPFKNPKIPYKNKIQRTITQERKDTLNKTNHNSNNTNNSNNNSEFKKKTKTKIAGKTYLIFRKDKNKNKINLKLSPDKSTPIKSSIYTSKDSNANSNRKLSMNINQSSRQNLNKFIKENNKNKNTIDNSTIRKNIFNRNINKIDTKKNSLNKKIKSISIDKNITKKKEEKKKYEIISKKNKETIKEIIVNYTGEDNTTVIMSKSGIKFVIKMFFENKKIEFKLNLVQTEKNKCGIIGDLIEGDLKNFEKLILILQHKLK